MVVVVSNRCIRCVQDAAPVYEVEPRVYEQVTVGLKQLCELGCGLAVSLSDCREVLSETSETGGATQMAAVFDAVVLWVGSSCFHFWKIWMLLRSSCDYWISSRDSCWFCKGFRDQVGSRCRFSDRCRLNQADVINLG